MSEWSAPVAINLPSEDTGRVFSEFYSPVCDKDDRTPDLQEGGNVH